MTSSLWDCQANVVSARSPLSALLCREAVAVDPTCTLAEAVAVMEAESVSALLVERIGGIVTERDLARALGHGVAVDEAVAAIATLRPLVVPGTTTVASAGATMLNRQVRHLVVDLGDRLTVVSLRDITAVLLQGADPRLWLTSLRLTIEAPSELWLG